MTILYTPDHNRHQPVYEIFNGVKTQHAEVPTRIDNILADLRKTEYLLNPVEAPVDLTELRSILERIHESDYLHWLENIHVTEAIYPSVFNPTASTYIHGHPSIQWGNFCTDMFTPLLPATWATASIMAHTSMTAAELLLNGESMITVIGRPPGHHAGRSRVGGYCYLNNAAVSAQHLSKNGRVAILDLDYHHGNGTQDIFYERDDVITCSIHAHPQRKFPYFAGFENEVGLNQGEGYNLNFPLEAGVSNQQYQSILDRALAWLTRHSPEYLIISLGLDTHESDPIADFKLTTDYYQQMAETIQQLKLPTIVILEGGYGTQAIGKNMVSFLKVFI